MAIAVISDVEVSLGRDLTSEQETQALGLLDRVEARIRLRIPTLDTRLADEDGLLDILTEVEADAVARVLRNPSGLLQEQDGDYAYTRDRRVASGALQITADEWDRLGVNRGAFTIDPTDGFSALLVAEEEVAP